jgi:hypothetical protein
VASSGSETPRLPAEIAGHEACHCVAAFLLGRRIESVSIVADSDSGGRALIYALREPPTIEEALVDIAIFTIADIYTGWRSMASGYIETGISKEDEEQAFACATKILGAESMEWRPIVELGRARAHLMLRGEDFRACHEALVPELLNWKTLPGEIVEGLLAAAITGPGFTGLLASEAEDFLAEHGQDFAAFSPSPRGPVHTPLPDPGSSSSSGSGVGGLR